MKLTYPLQWGLTIILTVVAAMLAVILVTDPEMLGLTPVARNWLAVAQAGVAAALALLPRIQRPPDPERTGLD